MNVAPFPWHTLDRIPRELACRLRDLRRAAARVLDPGALDAAIASVVGRPARVVLSRTSLVVGPGASDGGIALSFASRDGAMRMSLELERDLAVRLVELVLGPNVAGDAGRIARPDAPPPPALSGAVAAIVAQIARRAHGSAEALRPEALRPIGPGPIPVEPSERRVAFDASVSIDGEAFAVRATAGFAGASSAAEARSARAALRAIGGAPIALSVVAAQSLSERRQLAALRAGDVWMPGPGWLAQGVPLEGAVALVAPGSARAIHGRLGADGRIMVVGPGTAPLELLEGTMNQGEKDEHRRDDPPELAADTQRGAPDDGIAAAVLDVPLVVRVEIGEVSMTAREWADLGPGDVLLLGRRIADPAILRVSGVEVASGELVDVEGELGVRIRAVRLPAAATTKASA